MEMESFTATSREITRWHYHPILGCSKEMCSLLVSLCFIQSQRYCLCYCNVLNNCFLIPQAAEAEMKERQLAGFLARQSDLQNPVSEDKGGVSNGIIRRITTPSAWDGLGVLKTGLSTRVKGNLDLEGSSPKQDVREKSSFKILGFKRKQSSSIESRASKSKEGYTLGNSCNTQNETYEGGDVTCRPTVTPNSVEIDEIKSWHGLIGYGSEESNSDDEVGSLRSSAKESEVRNDFQGEAETRSKDIVCPSVYTDIHGLIDEKIPIRDSINEGTVVDETGSKGDVCSLTCANAVSHR